MLNMKLDQLDELKKTILALEKIYPCDKDAKPIITKIENKSVDVSWEASLQGSSAGLQATIHFNGEGKVTHAEIKIDGSLTWRPGENESPKEDVSIPKKVKK